MFSVSNKVIRTTGFAAAACAALMPLSSFAESTIVNDIAQQNASAPTASGPQIQLGAQAQKDGVTVNLLSAVIKDDSTVGLNFYLTSDKDLAVESVTVKAKFYDDEGDLITTKIIPVLRATQPRNTEYLTPNQPQMRQALIRDVDTTKAKERKVELEVTQVDIAVQP